MHPFKFIASELWGDWSPPFTHNLPFDALFSNVNAKVTITSLKSFAHTVPYLSSQKDIWIL